MITQRRVALSLLTTLACTTVIITIILLTMNELQIALLEGIAALTLSILTFAYWKLEWDAARYVTVVLVTILAASTIKEPFLQDLSFIPIIPPILALILTSPGWVLGSALIIYGTIVTRAGMQGAYAKPLAVGFYIIIIVCLIIGRLMADSARYAAEENAERAEVERARAEQQARDLIIANEQTRIQLEEQLRTLELVTTLETPVVPLAEGVLFAPIIGHMDARRADALTTRLLQEAGTQHPRLVVLDIAGVTMIDTSVARALLNMARALRLLGCAVTISGISANVALSLIHLGVSLDDVRTARNPQEALAHHLSNLTLATPELA